MQHCPTARACSIQPHHTTTLDGHNTEQLSTLTVSGRSGILPAHDDYEQSYRPSLLLPSLQATVESYRVHKKRWPNLSRAATARDNQSAIDDKNRAPVP